MRNYVIINGVNSLTIQGLAINNLPPITKPMIRTQREEIDGRDGDIVTELGYSAYDKQMEIGLYGNFDIDEIIKYFTGEGTIVFSNEADKYYNFKILDQIDYEKLLKFKTAVVTFHCQPFKYPLEEEPVEAEITTITGTGESITLENVEEAPMKIVYKGNTYQYSTSGKNLFNPNVANQNCNVSNGVITITTNTTDTYIQGQFSYVEANKFLTLEAGSYYMKSTNSNIRVTFYGTGSLDTDGTQPRTLSEETKFGGIRVRSIDGTSLQNKSFSLMLSTTGGEYEPYTNGASPNPDYPQEIQVVSGDNEVQIYGGSNLYDYTQVTGGWLQYTNGAVQTSGATTYGYTENYIEVKPNTSYVIDLYNQEGLSYGGICQYDSSKTFIIGIAETERVMKFTTTSTTKYIRFVVRQNSKQEVTFNTSQSYPINLPVENLFDNSQFEAFTSSVKYITLQLQPNTNYTLSSDIPNGGSESSANLFILNSQDSPSSSTNGVFPNISRTATTLSDGIIKIGYRDNNNTLTDESTKYWYMLEKGTKANHYTPYGTTPIWLGWIKNTNYGDKIDKSTGKQLFELTNDNLNASWDGGDSDKITILNNSTLQTTANYQNWRAKSIDLPQVQANKTYTLSLNVVSTTGNNAVVQVFTKTTGQSGTTALFTEVWYIGKHTKTFTIGEVENIGLAISSQQSGTTIVTEIMLNEGSTALPYEPYGTSWYLKKEIGKVVLNGSEDSWVNDGGGAPYKYVISDIKNPPSNAYTEVVCNNYYPIPYNDNWSNYDYLITRPQYASTIQGVKFKNKDISSLNDFKTWLSTHNTEVYYVLATPTYTLIEGELLNQLEAIKMSYEGQTNLSQTNNDLPFELDASVTFLTPMEINNIGNIYAKPILTIEGTGNIGVVLNGIQILEIDLSNNGKITIDVPKLEAYDPDDDTLLNRLVTGDYMKLLINEGDNKITFTGEVSGATLTNYIRWI